MQRYPLLFILLAALTACHSPQTWHVTAVEHSRLLVDSSLDARLPAEAVAFLRPYTHVVDSVSCPLVGRTAHVLRSGQPESELSNLLADIMVWAGTQYGEHPDLGIYNMGGIRASLPAGDVTYGNVVDVAPFDNRISFLTLRGEDLTELFRQIAARGGEGVSRGVRLEISDDGRLLSARLNGKEVCPDSAYRLATIDYLAAGNDGMTAFKRKTDFRIPSEGNTEARYVITRYLQEAMAAGRPVAAPVEGRIVVKK